MKERQRWQPEEDSLLRAYVKQYGPKEWNLISQRMGVASLNRDPKSCLERWKNYLKPGIKKGSLTLEEQNLVIALQAKYGNKWKKIAAEVPGRTAKRLGKWWEVFKEKQLKQLNKGESDGSENSGKYDHILDTFAEKYVQPKLLGGLQNLPLPETPPVLSEPPVILPPWMNTATSSASSSPSVSLSLSPSEPEPGIPRFLHIHQLGTLIQELEEGKENWVRHKKEATWRLTRVEQQLESEKARRRREKTEDIETEIQRLRDEGAAFVSRMEGECREKLKAVQVEVEAKEAKLMEAWCSNHAKLLKLLAQLGSGAH